MTALTNYMILCQVRILSRRIQPHVPICSVILPSMWDARLIRSAGGLAKAPPRLSVRMAHPQLEMGAPLHD